MSSHSQQDILHVESIPLPAIASAFGTPTYVYSRAALESAYCDYANTLDHHPSGKNALICYAIKANSNLAILQTFVRLGAGFDIVSGGELRRVLQAGAEASKVVFSGVGKSAEEIAFALEQGIRCFNVESTPELERINRVATKIGKKAPVSLRVNPDVDAKTHPYISTGLKENKFGIAFLDAREIYRHAARLPGISLCGIDCHIGSQILETAPFIEALDKLLALITALKNDGIHLEHLDLGGGLGIQYQADQNAPAVADYLSPILDRVAAHNASQKAPLSLIFEPGRRLVGNAGILLTRVEYLKHGEAKDFAIVDAAMNDLMRPALYDAWHDIVAIQARDGSGKSYDIVGPICESGDFLGHARQLSLEEGDLLAIQSAGAYGMAMSSNYNSRPRAAEVLVDGHEVHLIRQREHYASLWQDERLLP